jgi:hypothetical protein
MVKTEIKSDREEQPQEEKKDYADQPPQQHVHTGLPPCEQMFYVLRKGINSICQESLTPKDSISRLVEMIGENVFTMACQENHIYRFIGPALEAHNFDAQEAVDSLAPFLAEAVWDTIMQTA